MSFSKHATLLMRDCKNLETNFTRAIARIATLMERLETADTKEIRQEVSLVSETLRDFADLEVVVAQGPDSKIENGPPASHVPPVTWQQLRNSIQNTRLSLLPWRKIERKLLLMAGFGQTPLYPYPPDGLQTTDIRDKASDKIFDSLHAALNRHPLSVEAQEMGAFADIPMPHTRFLDFMMAAHRITLAQGLGRPARFLDVGCGGGLKVLSAAQFFAPAEGFDFDPLYVATAQDMLEHSGQDTAHAFKADGLTFEHYGEYDVIYFYRPLSDVEKLCQLEDRIVEQARPDALLIAPYSNFAKRFESLGCAEIASYIHLAQGTQKTADALCKKAEFMGPIVPPPDPIPQDILSPLATLLRANGFG